MLAFRWLILLGLLVALPISAAAEQPNGGKADQGARKKIVATPEQIAAWVRELDADEFAKREEATASLSAAGRKVVDCLADANLAEQNLEVVTRAVAVLQELSLSDDRPTEDAARELLEKLADSANGSVSQRAAGVLDVLNEARQSRAMEDLDRVGVKVAVQSRQVGALLVHEVPTVLVDESFTGKIEDLRALKYLPDAKLVEFSGPHIDDAAVRYLEGMTGVEYLTIKRAKITNKCVQSIQKLKKLRSLNVLYSPIDDNIIADLAKLENLTEVKLYGTNLTRAGSRKLADEHGSVAVDFRDGAFLGIGCTAGRGGCEVTIVHERSAAGKAGIAIGDVIVRFGGEPVPDFMALTALISKYKAGDKVVFEVIRGSSLGDKAEKIEVTLGEWE